MDPTHDNSIRCINLKGFREDVLRGNEWARPDIDTTFVEELEKRIKAHKKRVQKHLKRYGL